MDEEAIEQPCEPKKELEDTTVPGEGVSGMEFEGVFQIAPDSASPSMKDTHSRATSYATSYCV